MIQIGWAWILKAPINGCVCRWQQWDCLSMSFGTNIAFMFVFSFFETPTLARCWHILYNYVWLSSLCPQWPWSKPVWGLMGLTEVFTDYWWDNWRLHSKAVTWKCTWRKTLMRRQGNADGWWWFGLWWKKQAAAISEQKVGAGEGKTETVHVNAQIIALICSFPPREESIKLV